ncbi:hypothetical protein L931_03785 [Helicobacter pylori PZ5024]|uniref:Uncharacterized protein n=1 Tax=Helicobacter pylori PZ5024 TaxID=1337391 RepID=T2SYH5_HELPX|nr:hypothetical protein L931_03785 [Helicobacter pylori PZ5024]EQD99137.1 hypothetical protein L930_03950 [Helicobacter pylori PZ5004]
MLKRPAIKQPFKTALAPILGLVFKKRWNFKLFSFIFHYAMGIFGSVILKLLFLKMGFFCFVILKLIF